MKKMNLLKYTIFFLAAFLTTTHLYADETQPKFTIIPSTQTKWVIPSNGNAQVIYTVTNQTKITRTLTMKPIPGITQTTTGAGVCGSTFTLAHGQSCQLFLPLVGSQLSGHITQGPVICKTNGHGDNRPDPFLCSQPSRANSLDILSVGFEHASISVRPSVLTMIVGPNGLPHSSTLTVTNNSHTVTALNITAHFPFTWGSNVTATTCNSIAPESTCQITITQGNVLLSPENVPIYGDNTTKPTVLMSVVTGTAPLSVSPASIILQDGGLPKLVTVTNISTTGVVAHDVTVYLPRLFSEAGVTANPAVYPSPPPPPAPTYCLPLNPGDSCTLTFTPPALGDRVVPSDGSYSPVPIRGSNTTEVNELVKLEYLNATIDAQPRTLALIAGSTTTQIITVSNISSPSSLDPVATDILTTTTANFSGSALSGKVQMTSNCTDSLPRGNTCYFAFQPIPNQGSIGPTFFNIAGSNTNAVPVSISVSGAILNWSDSSVVVQNSSIVLATAGIFTPASGAGTAQSKSRYLTVYNTGPEDSLNVHVRLAAGSPPLPSGTTVTTTLVSNHVPLPVDCGSINAGASCRITIYPSNTPSTLPPSAPVPTTIEVADDLSNTITADITLLTYGNEYENGFVYHIDDLDDRSVSVAGRVVARSNEAETNILWNSEEACSVGPCTPVIGTNASDGFANTALIISTLSGMAPTPYAAQLCYDKSMSVHEWYLPSACELAYGSDGIINCGTSTNPAFQNIMSNAPQNPQNAYVWSSTATGNTSPQGIYVNAMIAPSIAQDYLVNDIASVRCAKKFGSS